MSEKCAVIDSCILFLAITFLIPLNPMLVPGYNFNNQDNATLTLLTDGIYSNSSVKCTLRDISGPSLRSFIQATSGDQDSRLNGLAVYLELADACQPLEDVTKGKVQLHKVALVTLKNHSQTGCSFYNLAMNAQNAGYTVLIHFGDWPNASSTHEDKLLIPVLNVEDRFFQCRHPGVYEDAFNILDDWDLSESDLTNVEIASEHSDELKKMRKYLDKLYYWFLVGPIITLEWLRRTKKFCWMSGDQQLNNNGLTDENGAELRTMDEGGSGTEGSHLHSTIENYRDRDGEEQPLLTTQPTVIDDYMRQPRGTGYVNIIRKIPLCEIAVGVLAIAALPVGISCGGLSFFRFDDGVYTALSVPLLHVVWPTIQIFCFFMYSRFACKITWTIQTEFSKLIRSDWFASNIYLLVLGVVVPYCSLRELFYFPYFVTYNTVCTVCKCFSY